MKIKGKQMINLLNHKKDITEVTVNKFWEGT